MFHRKLWLAISLICFATVAQDTVRLTNGEWAPYLSQHLNHYGFASHVVSEAFAAVDVKVEYDFFPWARAHSYARRGYGANQKWHGSLVWLKSAKRKQYFVYSQPVIFDQEVLFFRKDSPINWHTIDDLKGLTIGAVQHVYMPLLEQAEKSGIVNLEKVGDYPIQVERILHKRVDAISINKEVGLYYLRTQLPPEQQALITYSPNAVQSHQYYLVLNKKDDRNIERIELFNKGLAIIKQNGRYQQMLEGLENGYYDKPLPKHNKTPEFD